MAAPSNILRKLRIVVGFYHHMYIGKADVSRRTRSTELQDRIYKVSPVTGRDASIQDSWRGRAGSGNG